ncbi:MAG: Dabb family protein [Solirubrobacterales bacterium]
MVTHVVFFRFKDKSPAHLADIKARIESLREVVPVIRHLEVGIDVLHEERSWDLALIARFDSLEDLDRYQKHPAHVEVAQYIVSVREASAAVDYAS